MRQGRSLRAVSHNKAVLCCREARQQMAKSEQGLQQLVLGQAVRLLPCTKACAHSQPPTDKVNWLVICPESIRIRTIYLTAQLGPAALMDRQDFFPPSTCDEEVRSFWDALVILVCTKFEVLPFSTRSLASYRLVCCYSFSDDKPWPSSLAVLALFHCSQDSSFQLFV